MSGWSLAVPRRAKPIKRLVPAGGVYFFKDSRRRSGVAGRAMATESVCDDGQDRNDGFGLAVWGTW